jgi:NCS1 family nucleobase:cation symporter-1
MISSSMIVDGLSWWQSWICVWVGYFLAACFVCLTGRIGAVYHISFPVVCRSSFGVWGSLWPVLNRTVMAIIWYGVQGFIGGKKGVPSKRQWTDLTMFRAMRYPNDSGDLAKL